MHSHCQLEVKSTAGVEFIKIGHQIERLLKDEGIEQGVCHIVVPHTTAGVTINEGADPDVVRDMAMELNKVIPFEDGYRHMEGNSAAHIKASLMGSSASVIIEDGALLLGRWQSVFFCEFDGPRRRKVWVTFTP